MFSICNSSCIMMVQKESKVGYIENISLLLIAASTPLSFPKNSLCYCKWNQKHWDFPDVSIECWTRFIPLRTKSVRNIMLFLYDSTNRIQIPEKIYPSQIQKCRWRIVFYSTLSQFSNDILTLAPKQNLLFHIPLQIVINLPFRNTAVFCHKFHRLFFTAALR